VVCGVSCCWLVVVGLLLLVVGYLFVFSVLQS